MTAWKENDSKERKKTTKTTNSKNDKKKKKMINKKIKNLTSIFDCA